MAIFDEEKARIALNHIEAGMNEEQQAEMADIRQTTAQSNEMIWEAWKHVGLEGLRKCLGLMSKACLSVRDAAMVVNKVGFAHPRARAAGGHMHGEGGGGLDTAAAIATAVQTCVGGTVLRGEGVRGLVESFKDGTPPNPIVTPNKAVRDQQADDDDDDAPPQPPAGILNEGCRPLDTLIGCDCSQDCDWSEYQISGAGLVTRVGEAKVIGAVVREDTGHWVSHLPDDGSDRELRGVEQATRCAAISDLTF